MGEWVVGGVALHFWTLTCCFLLGGVALHFCTLTFWFLLGGMRVMLHICTCSVLKGWEAWNKGYLR